MTRVYISIHYDITRRPPFRIVRTYSADYALALRLLGDCIQQFFIDGRDLYVSETLIANDDAEFLTGRQFLKKDWPRLTKPFRCDRSCPGYVPGYWRCLQYQIRKLIEKATELLVATCGGTRDELRAEWADVISMIDGIRRFHRKILE